jgi:O-antigen/teichoic acid export membrane protein
MLRDSAIYILSRVLPSGLGFVTGMALTWLLTPDVYGIYGLGLTVVILSSGVFFDWLGLSFMRFYQANTASATFMPTVAQIFLLLCLASGLVAALACGIGWALGLVPQEYGLLVAISLPGCWIYSWFELSARVQVARFRATRYFWMNLTRNLLILSLGVAAAWAWHGAFPVLATSFLSMLIAALAFSAKGWSFRPAAFDPAMGQRLVKFGWPLAVICALSGVSFAIDRFLLKELIGNEAVGFYTVAYQLAQTSLVTIGAGIGSATYSLAVRAVESGDTAVATRQLSRNSSLLLALLLPASIGVAMVAPTLVPLFVDPAYVAPVASLVAWMGFAAFFYGFRANYVDHAFQLGHSNHGLLAVMVSIAVVNLALDVVLIPRMGVTGAGAASLAASAVGLVHGWLAARRVMRMPIAIADAVKILVAAGAMALFLLPFYGRSGIMALLIEIAGGALVYGALLLALDAMNLRGLVRQKLAARL